MIPGKPKKPVVIVQGDTFTYLFRISTGSPAVPLDLTGYTVRSQVRPNPKSAEILASMTGTVAADQVVNRGEVLLSLTPAQTSTLALLDPNDADHEGELGWWDVELTSPAGEVRTWIADKIYLKLEVTR